MVHHASQIVLEDLLVNVLPDSAVNDVKIVRYCSLLVVSFASFLYLDDPCASQPCMNQGICMSENGVFCCVCPPGYSGSRCEIRDACQNNPCMNGGTCQSINENGGYQCICPSGFSGAHCEISAFV
jgi:hypothetical protein